jgi:TRAP-type C4-dicarboxylate transport system permease small subunit
MNQRLRKILDIIANVGMAVFGVLAIILVSFKNP